MMFDIPDGTEALIFDCDGTLVDSMPLHMEAWRQAFMHFGAAFEEDFLNSLKGMQEKAVVESYNRAFGKKLNSEAMVRRKHDFFRKHMSEIKAIDPVADVARFYYGKLPLAVVSGSRRSVVLEELNIVGILPLFKVIFTADDPYNPKPAPDLFLEAARRMKVEPQRCFVFEDGESGIVGAKAAGMPAVNILDYVSTIQLPVNPGGVK
ncbi:MAG: HAD family phosphatase [Calditrichaceae bacterium]|nr:HAD family phosphatase [Calditrichaceae bacterium]